MRKIILAMTLMVLTGCPEVFAQGSTVPKNSGQSMIVRLREVDCRASLFQKTRMSDAALYWCKIYAHRFLEISNCRLTLHRDKRRMARLLLRVCAFCSLDIVTKHRDFDSFLQSRPCYCGGSSRHSVYGAQLTASCSILDHW